MIDSGDSSQINRGYSGRSPRAGAQRSSTPPIQRCSEGGRLSPAQNNNHPNRKQVVLPTVKRDYEKNGIPKDGLPHDGHMMGNARDGSHMSSTSGEGAPLRPIEDQDRVPSALANAMIKMKVEEEKQLRRESVSSIAGEKPSEHDIPTSNRSQDGYHLSHTPSLQPSQESLLSISTSGESIPSHVPSESSGGGEGDRSSSSSSGDEGEGEEEKAPFELMGEFLEAVMDEEFEVADKLCKMILLYEPDNAECRQFQPLIEEMLKREREAELLGSDDDDDDDEDESGSDGSDDDGSDDDADDEDDDDDVTEESSDESQDDSSSEGDGGADGQR